MSTINTNFTTGYEQQIRDQEANLASATGYRDIAFDDQRKLLQELNGKGYTINGKPVNFTTLEEWNQAFQSHTLRTATGAQLPRAEHNTGSIAVASLISRRDGMVSVVQDQQARLDALKLVHDKAFEPLKAMQEMLRSGDIEGAVMALQTSRVRVLDDQLKGRIAALQQRNADIAFQNTQLAEAQKALAGDKDNVDKQKAVADIKNNIDKLNSESQIDMIGIQQLVNKRNEAFDLLTNMLNKFQKSLDNIVGNIR